MKLVVIESPYAGDIEKNLEFCLNICRYAVSKGYSPYASHLMFTQFLDDNVPEERQAGIDCGLAWGEKADMVWICLRPAESLSNGMRYAFEEHLKNRRHIRLMRFDQAGRLLREMDLS
jgi:hypothetical protein